MFLYSLRFVNFFPKNTRYLNLFFKASANMQQSNEKFDKRLIVDPNNIPQRNSFGQALGEAMPNWSTKPLPNSEPIYGKQCRLELIEERHKNDLTKILNDQSKTSQYWRHFHGHPSSEKNEDEISQFLFKKSSDQEFQSRIVFAIISDESVKGVAEFRSIVPVNGNTGINIICSFDDSKIAQEAGLLLLERAFSSGYRRCEWRCNAHDEYSVDMALKLGLGHECVLRCARVRQNHNVDDVLFGITDKEWKSVDKSLDETLLSPEMAKFQEDKEQFKTRLAEQNISSEAGDNGIQLSYPIPNWSSPKASPKDGLLKGRLCRLEPLEHRHAEDLHKIYHQSADDRDWTYLFASRPSSVDGFKQWFDDMNKVVNRVSVAIVCNETNKPVGTAAFLRIDPENGVAEIGSINYSHVLQQTAMGTEAVYLMMKTLFDLGYRRCMWRCDIFNERSKVAAYRYGFTFEGLVKQDVVIKGRNYDVSLFSITDKEWPKIDEGISNWLSPTNFGEDGKQLKRLDEFMQN